MKINANAIGELQIKIIFICDVIVINNDNNYFLVLLIPQEYRTLSNLTAINYNFSTKYI